MTTSALSPTLAPAHRPGLLADTYAVWRREMLTILRDPSTQDEHVMTINGLRARFPAYRVSEHLVWGMTERIVRQLLAFIEE
jgi:hypothetical protein